MSEKTAVLAVSFGTSYPEAREKAIGGIEQEIREAFPDYEVRRTFTSRMVIRHITDSEGVHIDDPDTALKRAAADGVTQLLVQPTHVMSGAEYQKFMNVLEQNRSLFHTIKTGNPLLTSEEDFRNVCEAIRILTADYDDGQTAVILVGHGSETQADEVYGQMCKSLRDQGYDNYYVGTIESHPGVQELLEILKKGNYRRTVLLPFMVVAGDHARNDIAGTENSWKECFESAGYETLTVLKGLGEYPGIRAIYVQHLKDAAQF